MRRLTLLATFAIFGCSQAQDEVSAGPVNTTIATQPQVQEVRTPVVVNAPTQALADPRAVAMMSKDDGFLDYTADMSSDGFSPPVITEDWREYRTLISENWGDTPTFANRYVVIRAGCGAGCSWDMVGDHFTGKIYDLGLGGEEQMYLELVYRFDSTLIKAKWEDSENCIFQHYNWSGDGIESVGARVVTTKGEDGCGVYD